MRKLSLIVAVVVATFGALSASAQSQCASVYNPGSYWAACNYIYNGGFVGSMSPWQTNNSNFDVTHSGQYICNSWSNFEKSTGTLPTAFLWQTFTTNSTYGPTFSVSYTWQLENAHNDSYNDVEVGVYNVTDGVYEAVDHLNGGAGDIWCDTRNIQLYRPQWVGKQLTLYIYQNFDTSDTASKLTSVTFYQQLGF